MLKAVEAVSVREGESSKDKMWIDVESNNSVQKEMNGKEREEGVKEVHQEGQGHKTSTRKYRVSKTWK